MLYDRSAVNSYNSLKTVKSFPDLLVTTLYEMEIIIIVDENLKFNLPFFFFFPLKFVCHASVSQLPLAALKPLHLLPVSFNL